MFGREKKDVSSEEKVAEAYVKETVVEVKKEVKKLIDAVKGGLEGLRDGLELNKELSYEEAMKYFITHKDDSPAIAKGAILKENMANGVEVIQVFLDKDNQIVIGDLGRPLGYKRKVKSLDSELFNLFKGTDLIMVE